MPPSNHSGAPASSPYSGEEPIRPLPLELTFNGDDAAGSITATGVAFDYYAPEALEAPPARVELAVP